ncbi:hypothetical protein C8Q76DRAFT_802829 [Earliella scabrosa]|nr:hypothetical protein C8Q76DRAFT_802829 [Earliella scabrosa]
MDKLRLLQQRLRGVSHPTPSSWPLHNLIPVLNFTVLPTAACTDNPRRSLIATCDLAGLPRRPIALHAALKVVRLVSLHPPPPAPDVPDEPFYIQDAVVAQGPVVGFQFTERTTLVAVVRNDLLTSPIAYIYLTIPYKQGETVQLTLGARVARSLVQPWLAPIRHLELIPVHRIGGFPRPSAGSVARSSGPTARAVSASDEVLPHPRWPSIDIVPAYPPPPEIFYGHYAPHAPPVMRDPFSPLAWQVYGACDENIDGSRSSVTIRPPPFAELPPTPTGAARLPVHFERMNTVERLPEYLAAEDGEDIVDALGRDPEYVSWLITAHGSEEWDGSVRFSAWSDDS